MKNTLCIIFILISTSVLGGEAFFRPFNRTPIELTEGDSFKGVIELWNIQNISPEMVYELVGNNFLNSFFVVSLEKPKWSENNPEVVVIPGQFILEKKLASNETTWKLGGVTVNVTIKEISSKGFTKKQKGFVVLEGDYEEEQKTSYLIPAIIAFVLILLAIAFYFLKKKERVSVNEEPQVDWAGLILKAQSKEDFSFIYSNKEKWINKLSPESIQLASFLDTSKEYLFKKEVMDYELEQLKVIAETVSKEMSL